MYIKPVEIQPIQIAKRAVHSKQVNCIVNKEKEDAIIVESLDSDSNNDKSQRQSSDNNRNEQQDREQIDDASIINFIA